MDRKMDRRWMLWTAVALVIVTAVLMCGCRSRKEVETVERVRIDTTYITKEQRDSIFLRDSIYVKEYTRGETVYVEVDRWKVRYQERVKRDTVYRVKADTVIVEREVTIEKKERGRWKWKLALWAAIGLTGVMVWKKLS